MGVSDTPVLYVPCWTRAGPETIPGSRWKSSGHVYTVVDDALSPDFPLEGGREPTSIQQRRRRTVDGKREQARETYLAIDSRLGAYTRLRFAMVFAVGAVLSGGFYAIGLNYWLLVGAFVGLIEIVPVIGALWLSPRPGRRYPTRAHRSSVPTLARGRARIPNYFVNPHIGRTVGLSPLVTLLSVAVVGLLFGGLAVILAVPFTSAVATLIDVLVLGHQPPAAEPRRSLRLRRSQ